MPDSSNYPAPMPTRQRVQTLQAVRDYAGGGFDADAWHVMDQRDNALIADEVLNGSGSSKFVYQFNVSGTTVTGISVIGARHLAAHYGGIRHRLVAAIQKVGALFTFTSYPAPGMPMDVRVQMIPELEEEDDFYGAVVEISDIKTGNTIQVEKRETAQEKRRDGSKFDRPHFPIIAQAKAFRNGVLSLIPQDVQLKFKLQMLELGKDDVITASVLQQKRGGVLQFASKQKVPIDRHVVAQLTMAQIGGLSEAAREGVEAFYQAAAGLGILRTAAIEQGQPAAPAQQQPAKPPAAAQPAAGGFPETGGETGKSARPAQPAREAPAAPSRPVFEVYLVDEVGEVVNDLYADPLLLAQGYAALLETTPPAERAAVAENNAEALALAAQLSPEAARVLRELQEPGPLDPGPMAATVESTPQPDPTAAMPLTRNARGPDVTGWVKAAVARIGELDAAQLQVWVANNGSIYAPFPSARKLEISKALAARMGRPQEAAAAEGEDDDGWSYELEAEIGRVADLAALQALVDRSKPRAKLVHARNLAAYQRVDDALAAKRQALEARAS